MGLKHDWIKSPLGHGDKMCRRCFATDREANALGLTECTEVDLARLARPPAPDGNGTTVGVQPVDQPASSKDEGK